MSGKRVLAVVPILLLLGLSSILLAEQDGRPRTFIVKLAHLDFAKQLYVQNDPSIAESVQYLKHYADGGLHFGPVSVMEKEVVPPSGDKHDFLTFGPYYWPDPNDPDGPWLYRDGYTNPQSTVDSRSLSRLARYVRFMSVYYYLSGDETYAERTALLLRTYFLDESTRINPHIRYCSIIPGVSDGILSAVLFHNMFSGHILMAAGILEMSPAWSRQDKEAMQLWCRQLMEWAETTAYGQDQDNLFNNNHATAYDCMLTLLALYVDDEDFARRQIQSYIEDHMHYQFAPDGTNPAEIHRADSFNYHLSNLLLVEDLAEMAERLGGFDLWNYTPSSGGNIKKTVEFLIPYVTEQEPWPYFPAEEFPSFYNKSFWCLRRAAFGFSNTAYEHVAQRIAYENPLWQYADKDNDIYNIVYPPSLLREPEIYVDPGRLDDSGDGKTADTAKKTIKAAYLAARDGGSILLLPGSYTDSTQGTGWSLLFDYPKTLVVKPTCENADLQLQFSTTPTAVTITGNAKITFQDVSFRLDVYSQVFLYDESQHSKITFKDCHIDIQATNASVYVAGEVALPVTRTVAFDNCKITCRESSAAGMFALSNVTSFSLERCAVRQEAGHAVLVLTHNHAAPNISIVQCTLNLEGSSFPAIVSGAGLPQLGTLLIEQNEIILGEREFIDFHNSGIAIGKSECVTIKNNVFTNGTCLFYIKDSVGDSGDTLRMLVFAGNKIESLYGQSTVQVGYNDGDGGLHSPVAEYRGFVIDGNTVSKQTMNSGYVFMLGTNCHSCKVTSNFYKNLKKQEFGIVLKGDNHIVRDNVIVSSNPLYLYGSYNCEISNNTFVCIDGSPFKYNDGPAGEPGAGNLIYNNIFDGSRVAYAVYDVDGTLRNNYCDYNCYAFKDHIAYTGGVRHTSLQDLWSKWVQWSGWFPKNDSCSLAADPLFVAAAQDDFRLMPNSPCLRAGKLAPSDIRTTIGAWQPYEQTEIPPEGCLRIDAGDINQDCEVNMIDLTILAADWMNANWSEQKAH